MHRPSKKELFNKLRTAKSAVEAGAVFFLYQEVIADDAMDLEYDIGNELFDVLLELLAEATPDHYAGSSPPQKSYKDDIDGLELFPFAIESQRLGCRVYFKFAVQEDALWLVSLHKDRPKEG